MLRKLLLLPFICSATVAAAQHTAKTTEKQAEPQIDYKLPGAPMPPITFITYRDTTKPDTSITLAENKQRRKKKHAGAPGSVNTARSIITEKDIVADGNIFMMMYNPTCSHCQDQTILLEQNLSKFQKSKLMLIANQTMKQYMHDFEVFTKAYNYPFIETYIDSTGTFVNSTFKYQMLPQINIYSPDHKLLKIYIGEVAIDSLVQYIQ